MPTPQPPSRRTGPKTPWTFHARSAASMARVETRKILRSPLFPLTVAGVALMPVLLGILVFVRLHPHLAGNAILQAKSALLAGDGDWASFLALGATMMSGGILFVSGLAASWIFGREFTDRTTKDLLALPIHRGVVAIGKFAALSFWCLCLLAAAGASLLLVGRLLGLSSWSADGALRGMGVLAIASAMSLGLGTVPASLACATRGTFAPMAFVFLAIVLVNFMGLLGLEPYYPWGIPLAFSSHAMRGVETLSLSFLAVAATSLAGLAFNLWWWRWADHGS